MNMSRFEKVKSYYERKIWTKEMVRNAVGRWITPEEYQTITGESYKTESGVS